MFTSEMSTKFNVLCKSLFNNLETENIYAPLYTYDETAVNIVFATLHNDCNAMISILRERVNMKKNRYLTSNIKASINDIYEKVGQLRDFFEKNNYSFSFNEKYNTLFSFIVWLAKEYGINASLDEITEIPEMVIDEPLFIYSSKNNFKNIEYLIFGASKTKPDIVIKDVLEGNLSILNDSDILVYSDKIGKSLIYSDFKKWWQNNSNKYNWYKPEKQMNEIELKVQCFYKDKYGQDDKNPVLIPQVYLHYDPLNKKIRKLSNKDAGIKFQRMDFLIIFNGKRVIIEIDGKEHFQNTEEYSKQCKYDRDMKFLGYDVFRLGGHELTYNFEDAVSDFFDKLFTYLNIND